MSILIITSKLFNCSLNIIKMSNIQFNFNKNKTIELECLIKTFNSTQTDAKLIKFLSNTHWQPLFVACCYLPLIPNWMSPSMLCWLMCMCWCSLFHSFNSTRTTSAACKAAQWPVINVFRSRSGPWLVPTVAVSPRTHRR